jgi:hypothetical protein
MARLALGTDINGKVDFSLAGAVACEDVLLAPNVVTAITTPPNFNRAFFSYQPGTTTWVTLDGSVPAVPASTGASTQELNPSIRQIDINGGQTIKFISNTVVILNVRYDLGN